MEVYLDKCSSCGGKPDLQFQFEEIKMISVQCICQECGKATKKFLTEYQLGQNPFENARYAVYEAAWHWNGMKYEE